RLGRSNEPGAAPWRGESVHQLAAVEGRPAGIPENRQHAEQLGRVAPHRHTEGYGPCEPSPLRSRELFDVRQAGIHGDEADLRRARPRARRAKKIIWGQLWLER